MPVPANEILQDNQLAIGVDATRAGSRLVGEMSIQLQEAHRDIVRRVQTEDLTRHTASRLAHLERDISKITGETIQGLRERLDEALQDIAEDAATQTTRNLTSTIGVDLRWPRPDPATLAALAKDPTVQGRPLASWWEQQPPRIQQQYSQQLRLGIAEGETTDAITARITGEKAGYPQLMTKPRNEIRTLVRTSTNHAGNRAMELTYGANSEVIKYIEHVSTLDDRTSEICLARSGKLYRINPDGTVEPEGHQIPYFGGAPYHPNCRSVLVAVTKSWEELAGGDLKRQGKFREKFESALERQGKTKAQIKKIQAQTKASMDGQVPREMTMEDFLRTRPEGELAKRIGKARAKQFFDGNLTLTELIDPDGTPIPRKIAQAATALGIASNPPTESEFEWWKELKGQSATRNGVKWELDPLDRNAGRVIVEMSPEQIRQAHKFTGLDEGKLRALQGSRTVTMPRITQDPVTGALIIEEGQEKVLWAVQQNHASIAVSVPADSRVRREVERFKRLKSKMRGWKKVPEHPLGREDTISFFHRLPIQNRAAFPELNGQIGAQRKRGAKLTKEQKFFVQQFDGQPSKNDLGEQFRGVYKNSKQALAPDEAAQMAFDEGLIKSPTQAALYEQLQADATERTTITKRVLKKRIDDLEDMGETLAAAQANFEKKLLNPKGAGTKLQIPQERVQRGDVIQTEGQLFTVTDQTSDGGLIMKDGPQYPEVYWEKGTRLKAEVFLTEDIGIQQVPAQALAKQALEEAARDAGFTADRIGSEIQDLVQASKGSSGVVQDTLTRALRAKQAELETAEAAKAAATAGLKKLANQ